MRISNLDYSKTIKYIKCYYCKNDTYKIIFVYKHRNSYEIKICAKCGRYFENRCSPTRLYDTHPNDETKKIIADMV